MSPFERAYRTLLQHTVPVTLVPVSAAIAEYGAEMRSEYNLRTPDALHVASAVDTGCDAFLTNDLTLRRVTRLRVLVLDELEVGEA